MKKILSIIALSLFIAAQASAATFTGTVDRYYNSVSGTYTINGNTESYDGRVSNKDGGNFSLTNGTTGTFTGSIRNGNSAAGEFKNNQGTGTFVTSVFEKGNATVSGVFNYFGCARIFKIPSISDYSVDTIGVNQYRINLVGKNLPIRASSQIKWGKDLDEVSFAAWQPYGEVMTVNTDASEIVLWVKNSDSTGKTKTIRLK